MNSNRLGATFVVAIAALFGFSPLLSSDPAKPAGARPFVVGALQADGHLVPVASFDGRAWVNRWPAVEEARAGQLDELEEIPADWSGLARPLSDRWTLHETGVAPRQIRSIRPAIASNHCDENFALLTDEPARPLDCDFCCPYPIVGMALDSDIPVASASTVDPGGAEFARLRAVVAKTFDRLEEDALPDRAPVADEAVSTVETEFPQVVRFTLASGAALYRVEASRSYPRAPGSRDAECPDVSLFSAWIRDGGDDNSVALLAEQVTLTDCDQAAGVFVEPLLVLQLGAATYVVGAKFEYESQAIVIYEIGAAEVRELTASWLHAL